MNEFREIARVGEVIVSVEPVSQTVKIASHGAGPRDHLYIRGRAGLVMLAGALDRALTVIDTPAEETK